jgi:NAD-dependent SIR2 family protein deacetylase
MSFYRTCDDKPCLICNKIIAIDEDGCVVTVPSKKLSKLSPKTKSTFTVKWNEEKPIASFHLLCWNSLCERKHINRSERSIMHEVEDTLEIFSCEQAVRKKVYQVAEIMLLKETKQIVCFTGAGISASSGIPTYRGAEGIDTLQALAKESNYDKNDTKKRKARVIASAQPDNVPGNKRSPACNASNSDDDGNEDDYEDNDEEEDVDYTKLQPTLAHKALARLAANDLLHGCATQNCDNLHAKAGLSKHLISDLHGNVFVEYCEICYKEYVRPYCVDEYSTSCCNEPWYRECAACGWNHYTGRKCTAKKCKGLLKDTIVNFGDNLHRCISGGLNRAEKFFKNSDLCLALGTSLTVYPASDFPLQSKQLVIVNLQKTDLDSKADIRILSLAMPFLIC